MAARTPIPTRYTGSDEAPALPQSTKQREFQARMEADADILAPKHGFSRRQFLASTAGMAAGFLAMNQAFGPCFSVSEAEAAEPGAADERAAGLRGQLVMDMHTHFLRPDTKLTNFVKLRESIGTAGWNPELVGKPQSLADLMFDNYLKELYLDSDTDVACISGAPSDMVEDWFLTNPMKASARNTINAIAGNKRSYAHAIFTPGQPGWLEAMDRDIEECNPDSFKGYTIGDNTRKATSAYPWRMDDEKVAYKAYEKLEKAGLVNVCVHKGLFPPSVEKRFPHLLPYSDVRDVGQAAKDWPQLNFIIYHSGYRFVGGGTPEEAWAQFEATGRVEWVTDLAEIREKYGVTNVYADLGQIFAMTTIAVPQLAAVMLGQLVNGLGADRVCWGSDAIWTGAPQWQIEALRRLEIPEALQAEYGLPALGPADGPVKNAILGENNARLYNHPAAALAALKADGLSQLRHQYIATGRAPKLGWQV